MSKTRRVIRKTQPSRFRGVDDQLWPLVVALVVLGGFLAGTVLAYLKLDDARWYSNAWTWLITVALVIALALVTLARTGNRLLRRSMQLAIVLCAIVHLVLFIVAVETDVFRRVWIEVLAAADQVPKREVVKVPEYASWQHDPARRAQRDVEQPVQIELPDSVVKETVREETQEQPTDVELQPRPVPEPQEVSRPNVVKRTEPNESIPRQRDTMSQLSRRDAPAPQQPSQAVPVPDVQPRPERRESAIEPEAVGLQPETLRRDQLRQPVARSEQQPEPSESVRLARRPAEPTTRPDRPAPSSLQRRSASTPAVPRADAQLVGPTPAARQNRPDAPQPNNIAARQQVTRSPTRAAVNAPQQEPTAEAVSRRSAAEQPTPEQTAIAQTPRSVPNRRPRVTTRPDLNSVADRPTNRTDTPDSAAAVEATATNRLERSTSNRESAVARREVNEPASTPSSNPVSQPAARRRTAAEPRPSVNQVAAALPGRRVADATALGAVPERVSPVASEATTEDPSAAASRSVAATSADVSKQGSGTALAERRPVSTDSSGATDVSQTAMRQPTRGAATDRPSVDAQASLDQPPRRAVRDAAAEASPVVSESPAEVASASRQPSVRVVPSPMVLSRGETGAAGRGASVNMGQADPAAGSPATVASGSAQRADATQNLPTGPALTPHAPALVRHGRAGQARPSAVLQATPLNPAALPGSREPSDVSASSSAALMRAASDAAQGVVTASKGNLDVDTGPTTLVAEAGAGRAAGGGQPQRSSGALQPSVPRSPLGNLLPPSLLANDAGPTPEAPAAQGGGEVSVADVAQSPNARINSRQGAAASAPGGPRAAEGRIDAPASTSVVAASRRDVSVLDDPDLADSQERAASTGRKASRNRQLDLDVGVADLSVGNAADRNDNDVPAQSLAVNPSASATQKQMPGGTTGNTTGQDALRPALGSQNEPPAGQLAARAEVVDAAAGEPTVGGGTTSLPRVGRGPMVEATTQADVAEIAGAIASSGKPNAEPRSSTGASASQTAMGLSAARDSEPVGSKESAMLAATPETAAPGTGAARREGAAADQPGPVFRDATYAGGPGRSSPHIQLPSSAATVALDDEPSSPREATAAGSDAALIAGAPDPGPMSRLAGAELPVDIQAPTGPGGLGASVTVDVGLNARRASETSLDIQLETARFTRHRVGGMPDVNTVAAVPTESFRKRVMRNDAAGAPAEGVGPQTEEAIELGLVFLRQAQKPDGSWSLDSFAQQDGLPQLASDTAATGLALLAFQGAGYTHLEYRYADVVRQGVDFLVKNQRPDGCLYVPMDEESNRVVLFYSHSIAALALCEAYGMTQDANLRDPAQKALGYIVETQNASRGGWRYTARVSSDTSVTGWMMMALKSGELANLEVPDDTYRRIRQWLDRAQASESQPHLYCYNPYAPDTAEQRAGRRPTKTMTSVGLLMRLYSGWRRDNAAMGRGADYLLQFPPAVGTPTNPQRDTYYWYYATQVMFHMGGQHWSAWNRYLHPVLVDAQLRDGPLAGSWDPNNPVPDLWAPFAGRLYITTMNLLSLEVAYRHLPLYEDTAR